MGPGPHSPGRRPPPAPSRSLAGTARLGQCRGRRGRRGEHWHQPQPRGLLTLCAVTCHMHSDMHVHAYTHTHVHAHAHAHGRAGLRVESGSPSRQLLDAGSCHWPGWTDGQSVENRQTVGSAGSRLTRTHMHTHVCTRIHTHTAWSHTWDSCSQEAHPRPQQLPEPQPQLRPNRPPLRADQPRCAEGCAGGTASRRDWHAPLRSAGPGACGSGGSQEAER